MEYYSSEKLFKKIRRYIALFLTIISSCFITFFGSALIIDKIFNKYLEEEITFYKFTLILSIIAYPLIAIILLKIINLLFFTGETINKQYLFKAGKGEFPFMFGVSSIMSIATIIFLLLYISKIFPYDILKALFIGITFPIITFIFYKIFNLFN